MEQSGKGTKKGLITEEVEIVKNTNKDNTAKHEKIGVMTLIPC